MLSPNGAIGLKLIIPINKVVLKEKYLNDYQSISTQDIKRKDKKGNCLKTPAMCTFLFFHSFEVSLFDMHI